MDQRNTGTSFAPITAADGWADYAADQLALMDHLGIERFSVVGMCIGGAFIMELLAEVPERIAAAVAFQPIGLDGNRDEFRGMFDQWREGIGADHPEATDADWEGCWSNLFGGDQLLWSVPDGFLPTVQHPAARAAGQRPLPPQGRVPAPGGRGPRGHPGRALEGSGRPANRPRRRRPLLGRARLTTRGSVPISSIEAGGAPRPAGRRRPRSRRPRRQGGWRHRCPSPGAVPPARRGAPPWGPPPSRV